MKKRSQRDRVAIAHAQEHILSSGNTTATTSVNSGEPSPTNINMNMEHLGSMDSVHRYVPDYVAVSTRKTAV